MDNKDRNALKKAAARKAGKEVSNRLGVFFIIILLAFAGLAARMLFITKDNNDSYQQKILSQQAYNSKTIAAKRGEIIDCNGTILATSKELYNVVLDVKAMLDADEEEETSDYSTNTIQALTNFFGADASAVKAYVRDVPQSRYYVVKRGVSIEEKTRFESITTKPKQGEEETSLYNKYVTGVWFEKYYVRYYPQSTLACDVIGFSQSTGTASYGLEQHYNDILTGTAGRKYGFLSDEATYEVTTIPAEDGDTIVLTLDSNVQMILEKYLKNYAEEYKNNARDGLGANNIGCIVMRANSGEVIGMASYPNYDLNNPMDMSILYTDEEIALMEEEGTLRAAYDALWKNFCIADTYEPGSVMKPFTVAMGLETGKLTGNEMYYCTGSKKIGDYDIHCHNTFGDGYLDVTGAVAQSCNVALMDMVSVIGKDTFLKFQPVFNLGLKTNIDLSGEARTAALVFNNNNLGDTELATASFGQGFNVTMIQMCAGYAALVNGGYYYEPHVVSKVLSPSGTVVQNIEPRMVKQVISSSTSDMIIKYCNAVVTDGTGWRAKPAGYAIGGKTGTAETLPRGNGEYVVSFISHAPADNPEIICYVVIDRPNVSVQEDAKYATIVSKQILTELLPYLGIPMTEELTPAEIEELKQLDLSILTNRYESDKTDESGDGTANTPASSINFANEEKIDDESEEDYEQ